MALGHILLGVRRLLAELPKSGWKFGHFSLKSILQGSGTFLDRACYAFKRDHQPFHERFSVYSRQDRVLFLVLRQSASD
jgi:hypothetical protein